MKSRSRKNRIAASLIAIGLAAGLALTGCSSSNPTGSQQNPSNISAQDCTKLIEETRGLQDTASALIETAADAEHAAGDDVIRTTVPGAVDFSSSPEGQPLMTDINNVLSSLDYALSDINLRCDDARHTELLTEDRDYLKVKIDEAKVTIDKLNAAVDSFIATETARLGAE